MTQFYEDSAATEQLGKTLHELLPAKCIVFLQGNLGAGKTTLVRGFLRAAGFNGAVKSPTYNLVEEYQLDGQTIYHFDLYRLSDPEELEYIGVNDYFTRQSICFIEWPEMGKGFLPDPDYVIEFTIVPDGRRINVQNCHQSVV